MNLPKLFTNLLIIMLFSFFFAGESFSADEKPPLNNAASGKQEKLIKDKEAALIKEKYAKAIKTSSGLMYIVLKEGKGPIPARGALVEAHYTGRLVDGTKFDSSVDRGHPSILWLGKVMSLKAGMKLFYQ